MMKSMRAVIAALGLAAFLGANGTAGASNLAPEQETNFTPHQELMEFLMREPGDSSLLAGKRIAMIVVNGVDAVTLQLARDFLVEQGATVDVLTPRGQVQAASREVEDVSLVTALDYAGNVRPVMSLFLDETDPRSYQVIYLPGNHPDAQSLEGNPDIARYAEQATFAGTPIFAMGDASLLLARANLLRGGHATAARSLQPFLFWSGVEVYDEPVVRDDLIYTSRDAFDLPRMLRVMTQLLTTP